jgi:UDP-N-acetylmuramate-alanine ligase
MKSGLHDDRLAEAVSSADKVYWKSEDRFQIKRLVDSLPNKSVPLNNNKSFINDFESMNSKKDILIIMSNGDFNGLSRDLLDKYRND